MQYLLLINNSDELFPKRDTPEYAELMAGYMAFTTEVREAGVLEAGQRLQGADTATTVRVRNGKTTLVDGPFAETKEILGGYYLLNCETLDEALAYAAKIPSVAYGSIEVRPIMNY